MRTKCAVPLCVVIGIICVLVSTSPAGAQEQGKTADILFAPEGGRGVVPRALEEAIGGNRFALLVGINEYDHAESEQMTIPPLNYSVADAETLGEVLMDLERGGFAAEDVTLLTDNTQTRPTRENIVAALERLVDLAGPKDTVIVFFSGHGVQYRGKSYLLPIDATHVIRGTTISLEELTTYVSEMEADRVLVFLDACHSGGGVTFPGRGTSRPLSENFYQEAKAKITFTSCAPEEISYEWPEQGHGVFTYYILEGMRGTADGGGENRDGYITFSELEAYVGPSVVAWGKAQKQPRLQTPQTLMVKEPGEVLMARDPDRMRELQLAAEREQMKKFLRTLWGKLTDEGYNYTFKLIEEYGQPLSDEEQRVLSFFQSLREGKIDPSVYQDEVDAVLGPPPPPPPPPPGFGKVAVNASPWAKVFLDGKEVGLTPLTIEGVEAGTHTIRLEYDGKTYEDEVKVNADESATVSHSF